MDRRLWTDTTLSIARNSVFYVRLSMPLLSMSTLMPIVSSEHSVSFSKKCEPSSTLTPKQPSLHICSITLSDGITVNHASNYCSLEHRTQRCHETCDCLSASLEVELRLYILWEGSLTMLHTIQSVIWAAVLAWCTAQPFVSCRIPTVDGGFKRFRRSLSSIPRRLVLSLSRLLVCPFSM